MRRAQNSDAQYSADKVPGRSGSAEVHVGSFGHLRNNLSEMPNFVQLREIRILVHGGGRRLIILGLFYPLKDDTEIEIL